MLNLHLVARQFVLTCLSCGLPAEATESERRESHIANCSAWAQGFDCMHLEDEVKTCKCGELCDTCGERMEFDEESDTWDCMACIFCHYCEYPRFLHGCTARENSEFVRGSSKNICQTRWVHGSSHGSSVCDCDACVKCGVALPELIEPDPTRTHCDTCKSASIPAELREDVLKQIASLKVIIRNLQASSLRDAIPHAESDATAVLSFLETLLEAQAIRVLDDCICECNCKDGE